MEKKMETELKVGLFVALGLGLIMLSILLLSGPQNFFSRNNHYTVHFNRVDGLLVGAKVILNGVSVGAVESIELNKERRNIRITFTVTKPSSEWIRKDSTVEIATQGVLGDKYLSIEAGSDTQPILPPGSDIQNRPSTDIKQFLSQSDRLVISLNEIAVSLDRILKTFESDNRSDRFFKGLASTAANLSQASEKLNQEFDHLQIKNTMASMNRIMTKIDNGTGTIGALVNDPGLYDDVKALFGGANRNRIMRNLVRQTVKESKENPQKP
jgi:phospholipid/cholesterol/gamma-HCH transport system substrate-binding protein